MLVLAGVVDPAGGERADRLRQQLGEVGDGHPLHLLAAEVQGRLLDRLMDGAPATAAGQLLPPLGVAERASTDGVAIEHPRLRAALALAQARACDGIGIPALVRAAGMSRQALDRLSRRAPWRARQAAQI